MNSNLYETHLVSCSGARVPQLQEAAFAELKNIPRTDVVVMYICGGVNELSFKDYHDKGVELSIHRHQQVLSNLLSFKR